MSSSIDIILDRLVDLGFRVQRGDFVPFNEHPLPIVSATAWDSQTAQLVLIAEMQGDADADAWRQVLFAASGLRHHLARDGQTAFGTPLVIAIVDDGGQRLLRRIAEDLAERYVLFTRLDLNVVHHDDVSEPALLDDALAPLLPRCRELLGTEVARAEISEFWRAFVASIRAAADGLEPLFAPFRLAAADEAIAVLVDDDASDRELPPPLPISRLMLQDFRSIRRTDCELSAATIIHGPNGGGKSSLLEAMELDWAGSSQRRPAGVDAATYQRHLVRDSADTFSITADGRETTSIADRPRAELARCVLTHEAVAKLVSDTPEQRYTALVETTGLELPDIGDRIADLVTETKRRADAALTAAGLRELPRRNTVPGDHLRAELGAAFSGSLPAIDSIVGREQVLEIASEGAYQPRRWPDQREPLTALVVAEQAASRVLSPAAERTSVAAALDTAADALAPLIDARRALQAKLETLIIRLRPRQQLVERPPQADRPPHPISPELAARWLSHAEAIAGSATRFKNDAASIADETWAAALRGYAEALEDAARRVPRPELRDASRIAHWPVDREDSVTPRLLDEAGFTKPVASPRSLIPHLDGLLSELSAQLESLAALDARLRSHPARTFGEHANAVRGALCRFGLARELRQHSPMENAGEQIVTGLLQTRLAPAVRELVAAIVRFEWHFKPLIVPERGRTVVLGGVATSRPDLDARLLLNSAERTVLGLAWFLALHLLQPAYRRQVLVLDDPTAAFDVANQAGFISTLRAFVRLSRPAQIVVSTHDDTVAAILAEQLSPVDGWPRATARLRVQRDYVDASVVTAQWSTRESRYLASEVESLGLGHEPVVATS
jgi:hypothetical protein